MRKATFVREGNTFTAYNKRAKAIAKAIHGSQKAKLSLDDLRNVRSNGWIPCSYVGDSTDLREIRV